MLLPPEPLPADPVPLDPVPPLFPEFVLPGVGDPFVVPVLPVLLFDELLPPPQPTRSSMQHHANADKKRVRTPFILSSGTFTSYDVHLFCAVC